MVWDADIENRLLDTVEEREGGMIGESSIVTHKLPYVKWIVSDNLLSHTGNPKLTLCDNLNGWDGEAIEREIKEGGDIYIPVADSCWCIAEITIL